MRNLLLTTATALGALTIAGPASAGLLLEESVNGGGFTTLCSGNPCSPGGIFTDAAGLVFTFLGATSNSPGTPIQADVLQATVDVVNNTGKSQSVILRVSDTNYTAPSAPATLLNNLAGTVLIGGAGNIFDSIACVDGSNAQNACLAGLATPLISADITAPGSGKNSDSLGVATLGSPFSLTQVIDLTLDNGAEINYAASAKLAPAPEPTGLAILGVGLLGLGLVANRKRPA